MCQISSKISVLNGAGCMRGSICFMNACTSSGNVCSVFSLRYKTAWCHEAPVLLTPAGEQHRDSGRVPKSLDVVEISDRCASKAPTLTSAGLHLQPEGTFLITMLDVASLDHPRDEVHRMVVWVAAIVR